MASIPDRLRILVADDNEDAADVLAQLLALSGHDTRVAYDGQAAVDVARDFHPDVAVIDISMPRLDGYEVARQLRAQPWAGKGLMLVAVTGWGEADAGPRAAAAGFDHHLTKPLGLDSFEELLRSGRV